MVHKVSPYLVAAISYLSVSFSNLFLRCGSVKVQNLCFTDISIVPLSPSVNGFPGKIDIPYRSTSAAAEFTDFSKLISLSDVFGRFLQIFP